jgi:hypothetical protein
LEHAGSRIVASILPIATNLQSFIGRGARLLLALNALALVVFRIQRANGARDIRTDLQSRYGLTNAEAKIAEALSHGGSLAQIADRFGIAH